MKKPTLQAYRTFVAPFWLRTQDSLIIRTQLCRVVEIYRIIPKIFPKRAKTNKVCLSGCVVRSKLSLAVHDCRTLST